MRVKKDSSAVLLILATIVFSLPVAGAVKEKRKPTSEKAPEGQAVLWREPEDITSRNLFYGPGGKEHEPRGPFTFVKEDLKGTSPKFVVKDEDGMKWKVKLGIEARPETVATRITWAVGYYANED